jgi:hypothetical protein
MGTKFGLEWLVGSAVLPAIAMIVTGYPWMAAGTLGAALLAAVAVVRMRVRSARDRDREILSYASTAASFGTDPAPVIKALRAEEDRDVVAEARGPQLHVPRGRW